MTDPMPRPVAAYIAAANAHDPDAAAACFTEDAVVTDEARDHAGRAAIRAWIAEADRLYVPAIAVRRVTRDGADVVLHGEVSGTFPGSPVVLRFAFSLAGEAIARLTIVP